MIANLWHSLVALHPVGYVVVWIVAPCLWLDEAESNRALAIATVHRQGGFQRGEEYRTRVVRVLKRSVPSMLPKGHTRGDHSAFISTRTTQMNGHLNCTMRV